MNIGRFNRSGRIVLPVAMLVVALGVMAGRAQTPADPLDALKNARTAYDAALDKARKRLAADLDERIAFAKAAGRVEMVDELTGEKEKFLVEGTLPGSALVAAEVRSFRSSWRLAARLLVATLEKTERELTRADRLDEARQLQQERGVLESELEHDNPTPAPPPDDPSARSRPARSGAGSSGRAARGAVSERR